MPPNGYIFPPVLRELNTEAAIDESYTFHRRERLVSIGLSLAAAAVADDVLIAILTPANSGAGSFGLAILNLSTDSLDQYTFYYGFASPVYFFPGDVLQVVFPNGDEVAAYLRIVTEPVE